MRNKRGETREGQNALGAVEWRQKRVDEGCGEMAL